MNLSIGILKQYRPESKEELPRLTTGGHIDRRRIEDAGCGFRVVCCVGHFSKRRMMNLAIRKCLP